MYLCIQSAAAALCVAILLLLQLAVLLLAAAVRHRVPDGEKCSCGSSNLIPVCSFSSFRRDYLSCTPWQFCRVYCLDLPIKIHPR